MQLDLQDAGRRQDLNHDELDGRVADRGAGHLGLGVQPPQSTSNSQCK